MKVVLMSIKPKFSERIFEGTKRYELRRTPVKLETGDVVIVYASSPTKAVVGGFSVNGVKRDEVASLWSLLGEEFGVSQEEYEGYFLGAETGHAIEVGKRAEIEPVPLDELRQRFRGFRPPQSYMHWHQGLECLLGKPASKEILASRNG